MSPTFHTALLDQLLEHPCPWPASLNDADSYQRQHDDTDGGAKGWLQVTFGRDGDAYVSIDDSAWLRFRTFGGGGSSLRTYAALQVLAEAIRRDNADRPQRVHVLTSSS